MTISPNNIGLIEKYLQGRLSPSDKELFEITLLIDPDLRSALYFQKKTHLLIKMYNREKLKEELEALHQRIFNDPGKQDLRRRIYKLFN